MRPPEGNKNDPEGLYDTIKSAVQTALLKIGYQPKITRELQDNKIHITIDNISIKIELGKPEKSKPLLVQIGFERIISDEEFEQVIKPNISPKRKEEILFPSQEIIKEITHELQAVGFSNMKPGDSSMRYKNYYFDFTPISNPETTATEAGFVFIRNGADKPREKPESLIEILRKALRKRLKRRTKD